MIKFIIGGNGVILPLGKCGGLPQGNGSMMLASIGLARNSAR